MFTNVYFGVDMHLPVCCFAVVWFGVCKGLPMSTRLLVMSGLCVILSVRWNIAHLFGDLLGLKEVVSSNVRAHISYTKK